MDEYYKCDYADEINPKSKYCKIKRCKCDGNGFCIFDIKPERIELKNICKQSSLFGNYYIALSNEDIEYLKSGGCLGLTGDEYGFFIKIQEE